MIKSLLTLTYQTENMLCIDYLSHDDKNVLLRNASIKYLYEIRITTQSRFAPLTSPFRAKTSNLIDAVV